MSRELNAITGDILDAALKIHVNLGPGLLESVYEQLLAVELERRGHRVERQKEVSFAYEGIRFENAFRMDLLVDGCVVVELKSTGAMSPVYPKQVRTYLVLCGLQVGMVVNFGMATLKEGVVRVLNGHAPGLALQTSHGATATWRRDGGENALRGSVSPREKTEAEEKQS